MYELKYDGYRLLARKEGREVRLYSRRGADFTQHSAVPRVVEAMQRLRAVSALVDAEAIVYDHEGMPNFDYVYSRQYDHEVSLLAFDLLEKDGEDLRPLRLDERKRRLQHLMSAVRDGIEYIEHIEGDGDKIFQHACKLRHEGVVAKRIDRPYESGRSRHWVKIQNPDSPAMKRVQDETF